MLNWLINFFKKTYQQTKKIIKILIKILYKLAIDLIKECKLDFINSIRFLFYFYNLCKTILLWLILETTINFKDMIKNFYDRYIYPYEYISIIKIFKVDTMMVIFNKKFFLNIEFLLELAKTFIKNLKNIYYFIFDVNTTIENLKILKNNLKYILAVDEILKKNIYILFYMELDINKINALYYRIMITKTTAIDEPINPNITIPSNEFIVKEKIDMLKYNLEIIDICSILQTFTKIYDNNKNLYEAYLLYKNYTKYLKEILLNWKKFNADFYEFNQNIFKSDAINNLIDENFHQLNYLYSPDKELINLQKKIKKIIISCKQSMLYINSDLKELNKKYAKSVYNLENMREFWNAMYLFLDKEGVQKEEKLKKEEILRKEKNLEYDEDIGYEFKDEYEYLAILEREKEKKNELEYEKLDENEEKKEREDKKQILENIKKIFEVLESRKEDINESGYKELWIKVMKEGLEILNEIEKEMIKFHLEREKIYPLLLKLNQLFLNIPCDEDDVLY